MLLQKAVSVRFSANEMPSNKAPLTEYCDWANQCLRKVWMTRRVVAQKAMVVKLYLVVKRCVYNHRQLFNVSRHSCSTIYSGLISRVFSLYHHVGIKPQLNDGGSSFLLRASVRSAFRYWQLPSAAIPDHYWSWEGWFGSDVLSWATFSMSCSFR